MFGQKLDEFDTEDDQKKGCCKTLRSKCWAKFYSFLQVILAIAVGSLTVILYTTWPEGKNTWLGLQVWKWTLLASLVLLCPLVAEFFVTTTLQILVGMSHCRGKERNLLNDILYYASATRRQLVRVTYASMYLVAVIIIVRSSKEVEDVDVLPERAVASLLVYTVALFFAQIFGIRITRNFSTHNFILKLKHAAKQEIVLRSLIKHIPLSLEQRFLRNALDLIVEDATVQPEYNDGRPGPYSHTTTRNQRRKVEDISRYVQLSNMNDSFREFIFSKGVTVSNLSTTRELAFVISRMIFNAVFSIRRETSKEPKLHGDARDNYHTMKRARGMVTKAIKTIPHHPNAARSKKKQEQDKKAQREERDRSSSDEKQVEIVVENNQVGHSIRTSSFHGEASQENAVASNSPQRAILPNDLELYWSKLLRKNNNHLVRLLEVQEVWDCLNPAGTDFIMENNLERHITDILYERVNLTKTLKDASAVVNSLHRVLNVLASVITIFPVLALFQVAVLELWVGLSSVLLAFTFVFGNMAKKIFESIVFLFFVHAFDVGDVLVIKFGSDENRYRVSEIHLMVTHFERWDGASIRIDNNKLANEAMITNLSTSNYFGKTHQVVVDADVVTPAFMTQLREEMKAFIALHPDRYRDIAITAREVSAPLKAVLYCYIQHNYPDTDAGRTIRDYASAVEHLIETLMKYGAKYSGVAVGQVPMMATPRTPTSTPTAQDLPSSTRDQRPVVLDVPETQSFPPRRESSTPPKIDVSIKEATE